MATKATKKSSSKNKPFDIWLEGFTVCGQIIPSACLQTGITAPSFKEACKQTLNHHWSLNLDNMTLGGSRLAPSPKEFA